MVATPSGTYHQRGVNSLPRLFRAHFPQLVPRFETAWARLIRKVYKADSGSPLSCPRCPKPMKAIAVITDPA